MEHLPFADSMREEDPVPAPQVENDGGAVATPKDHLPGPVDIAHHPLYGNLIRRLNALLAERADLLEKWIGPDDTNDTTQLLRAFIPRDIRALLGGETLAAPSGGPAGGTDRFWMDTSRFNESAESQLYTRLLDMKRKLTYEVSTIKTWIEDQKPGGNEEEGEDEEESAESEGSSSDLEGDSESCEDEGKSGQPGEPEDAKPRWITVHRLYHHDNYNVYNLRNRTDKISHFLDRPLLYTGHSNSLRDLRLEGKHAIPDLEKYLAENPSIEFVHFKDYDGGSYVVSWKEKNTDVTVDSDFHRWIFSSRPFRSRRRKERTPTPPASNVVLSDFPPPEPVRDEVLLVSEALKGAMAEFENVLPKAVSSMWWKDGLMGAPFLSLYHYRTMLKDKADSVLTTEEQKGGMRVFLEFCDEHLEPEFSEADRLMERGLISETHWAKLFRPEDIVTAVDDEGQLRGYMCRGYPGITPGRFETKTSTETYQEFARSSSVLSLSFCSWFFNGQFRLEPETLTIEWPGESSVMRIQELRLCPLRFREAETEDKLRQRGRAFWQLRRRSYVCYDPVDKMASSLNAKTRYMIDYDTYRELHPTAPAFEDESRDDMGEEQMESDEPPGRGLELLFPTHIYGFAMQDKKWRKLFVDHISPINWNKSAFERLVLDADSKELVQALIGVHVATRKSADMIEGKGNGLLILLHGPPGTGKTLTAESVAEVVQRPLYRVTCGDIGTDAEGVEAYLESVLYIGKIWGCVVLLDEADVFLEERVLSDLQRNALVSVFLRVLEYYDGILILTSNRVGTFDEAFRSRIKLALHYKALTKPERRKVWRNFIKMLREIRDDGAETEERQMVDFDDLEDHLDDLADYKLNGREIRNALSTASELATFRKQTLCFAHVKHVIGVAGQFEQYLVKTKGSTTDALLKDQGIRS